jgi:4-oxalocrotonate tautomerase
MPVLHVYLFEGRTVEQKANLMRNLTQAVTESLGSPAQNVRIMIQDMPKHNYAVGGVSVQAREDTAREKQ